MGKRQLWNHRQSYKEIVKIDRKTWQITVILQSLLYMVQLFNTHSIPVHGQIKR